MTSGVLISEVRDQIGYIRLNRPDQRNALNVELIRSLVETFAEYELRDDVWAIHLSAEGQGFCAGADLKETAASDSQGTSYVPPMRGPMRNVFEVVSESSKPTLAAINGWAVGGGCELALACDLRVAEDGARLMLPEAKVGFGANFASQMLARLVPMGIAYQMLYLGEPVSAAEAKHWGLVNWVVPGEELAAASERIVRDLITRAPLTLRRYKAMVRLGSTLPIASALRLDPAPNPYASLDRAEGARAFTEKRAPQWQGR